MYQFQFEQRKNKNIKKIGKCRYFEISNEMKMKMRKIKC